ncbi:putative glycoside hydrolase [Solirubrobacter ginsenosidimutans]|uniref:Glycoside hydrolase n=1 Tax=Solirubrobacter ginsenosidimutans TaxID=490573 RepID=A0A9X3MZH2_9ACTN|nr:carbohydrate-binding domain-containing protein [Solirubrobacter ginsenosidimutans]MDA0164223.1 putative glycoside hydrolase [Solirubrobacter ginsenosidimutans]
MQRTSRLVSALVLVGAAIASGSVEPAFSATSLVTLEAESMSATTGKIKTDATANGGRSYALTANGALSASINPASPVTSVTIRAKGDQCQGAPALALRVDGATVQTFSVTGTSWTAYTTTAAVPAGGHTVTLAYTNDRSTARCNRNLYLDTATFSGTTQSSSAPQLSVRHLWTNSDGTSAFSPSTDSARTDVFIAHAFDSFAQADAYHANRPAGQAYFYADFGVAGDPCCVASVLDAATVDAHGWWATHNGARIPNPWGGASWLVDLGKPGVAAAYAAALEAKWGAHNWQGVFADDINAWRNLGYAIDGYASAGDWINRAVVPLVRTVTGAIAADKGGVVIPNIGNWPQEPDMDAVADAASGGLNEWYLTWGGGAGQAVAEIEAEYASMRRAIAGGRTYLGIVHSTALTRYAFCAAAIMGERDKVLITNQTSYGSAPLAWDPVFDLDLGAATEPTRHTAGSTAWSRRFTNHALSIDTGAQTCTIQ